MGSSAPIKLEISAGGVVYKPSGSSFEVCLIATRNKTRWQLPKGLVEKGEPLDVAAQREAREETGLEGEVVERLDKIDYWFAWKEEGKPVRHHKIVYFYLIRCTGGDTSGHDHEVDEARWFPIEEAIERMSFRNEREIVQKARDRLEVFGSGRH